MVRPYSGFKLTEDHKNKISQAHIRLSLAGKKSFRHSEESIRKITESSLKYPMLYDKEFFIQKYVIEKKSLSEIANLVGSSKVSASLYRSLKRHGIGFRGRTAGANHWQWKGGISKGLQKNRTHVLEYVRWRKSVFERDNYTCRACKSVGDMEAHHILPVREFPHLIYSLDNGMTLCVKCHKKTIKRENLFIRIYEKQGELPETLKVEILKTTSSQAEKGISRKVQRLEDETRTVGNSSTSPLPVRDEIARTA